MIERETKLGAEERPLVSSVIYNRLARSMNLEIDATVLSTSSAASDGCSTATSTVESPYNTYLHRGLPPGPIANPGAAALEAAAAPARHAVPVLCADGQGRVAHVR